MFYYGCGWKLGNVVMFRALLLLCNNKTKEDRIVIPSTSSDYCILLQRRDTTEEKVKFFIHCKIRFVQLISPAFSVVFHLQRSCDLACKV